MSPVRKFRLNSVKTEELLLLVDSCKVEDRLLALDLFSQFLSDTREITLLDFVDDSSFKSSLIFSIFTRCDDISPAVRIKALSVMHQNMKCILVFLEEIRNKGNFQCEISEDISGIDLDVNGNRRYFWYFMNSFTDIWNEFEAILHRRIEDNSVTARKSALLAFENLLVANETCITKENLKCLQLVSKDVSLAVRKQLIQSLTVLLITYPDNSLIQEYWLKCILPLVGDTNTSVQAKALLEVERQFLQNVFSSKEKRRLCALTHLEKLSSSDFLVYQRFLKKAFCLWKWSNKLKAEMLAYLPTYFGTQWEDCIWFYISCFTLHYPIPSAIPNLCVSRLEKAQSDKDYPLFMEHVLQAAGNLLQVMDSEALQTVYSIIKNSLKMLTVPVELISTCVEIFFKIHKHKGRVSEFEEFSSEVLQKCQEHLLELRTSISYLEAPTKDLLAKCLCSIKELCPLYSSNTLCVASSLHIFIANTEHEMMMSPSLKASAYAALGKLCLQNESLAHENLPMFIKELLLSEHDVIRNNTVIILADICKRYPLFADKCILLISLCVKDRHQIIRYQTVVLLANLLQGGYVRWQVPLFFAFLSALLDKNEDIREIGRYILCQLLHEKKSAFFEHFVESIFVLNGYTTSGNEAAIEKMGKLEMFSAPGEKKREDRLVLFKFLLEPMTDREKAQIIKSLCDIFVTVAESSTSLNKKMECILRDCFAILTCPEINLICNEHSKNVDEVSENEFNEAEVVTRKKVIVHHLIPTAINLKDSIMDSRSDLSSDIILFLKELLADFKHNLENIISEDPILLRQLEFENNAEIERFGRV